MLRLVVAWVLVNALLLVPQWIYPVEGLTVGWFALEAPLLVGILAILPRRRWSLWLTTLSATILGFFLAGLVPLYVTLGFVFLNPLYFMLVFIADLKHRLRALALVFGALLGPALHLIDPEWGLLATGLIGGTAAFLIDTARRRRGREWRR